MLVSGAGYIQNLGYLTASQSALDNPKKAAAIADFVKRFYKAQSILPEGRSLPPRPTSKIYGVTPGRGQAGRGVGADGRDPDHPGDHQLPADGGQHLPKLGTDHQEINVKASVFDLPLNKLISKPRPASHHDGGAVPGEGHDRSRPPYRGVAGPSPRERNRASMLTAPNPPRD